MRFSSVEGRRIHFRFKPSLTAAGGKLLSRAGRGQPVYAGALIRKREVVMDATLRTDARELSRIFVHEVFHFAWVRLGNARRREYEELLRSELRLRARGELGWSSEDLKGRLHGDDRDARWRAYVCESFCDTAAFLYSSCRRHEEFTLAPKWRRRRAQWFEKTVAGRALSI